MPKSHPSRGAWIEIAATINQLRMALSHPSRGAWIEITLGSLRQALRAVAPLAGCVD